jgi:hypothetical protein
VKGTEVADFAARDASGNWKIAEFKGSDVGHAVEQLQNTYDALLKDPSSGVKGRVEFEIHVDGSNFEKLSSPKGLSGYRIDANGHLAFGENPPFTKVRIDGVPVQITK